MRTRYLPLVSLLAALLFVAPACGDEDKSASTPEASNPPENNTPGDPDNQNNNHENNPSSNNTPTPNNAPTVQPQGGPNDLVDLNAIVDPATLQIEIDKEGSGIVQSGDQRAWLVNFSFVSQTFAGEAWRHQASLYLPLESAPGGTLGIVHREPAGGFTENYGILMSAITGIPILLLNDLPPVLSLAEGELSQYLGSAEPRCRGSLGQPDLFARCMLQIVQASGDPSLDPFLQMAVVYSRGITAAQNLHTAIADQRLDQEDPPPPSFSVDKAALFGGGVRGSALPIAAAFDPRVEAIYQDGAAFGSLEEYFNLQNEVWTEGYTLGDPETWTSFLRTEAGSRYKEALDPAEWPEDLMQDKLVLFSWGTQSTYAPLRAFELYRSKLSARTYSLALRDQEDGIQSDTHLQMWRAFLRASNGDRAFAKVTLDARNNNGSVDVSARIEDDGGNNAGPVTLLYVQRHRDNDDEDFRDAVWETLEMERKDDGSYNATFAPLSNHSAAVVLYQDTGGNPPTDALVASPVVVIVP